MVIVSKATATNSKGEIKKGYRCIKTKNGREMYMTESVAKDKKEPKKKMPKKKEMMNEEMEKKPKKPRKKKTVIEEDS